MAGNLRGIAKLQSFSLVFDLYHRLLLSLFRRFGIMGMERDIERGAILRVTDASKLCYVGCHLGDNWYCSGWVYRMAYSPRI